MKKNTKSAKVIPTPIAFAAAAKPAAKGKILPKKVAPVARPATASAPRPTATTILALIDVGFGNTLYLRGDGPGLSWNQGIPLDCVADDRWSLAIAGATGPFAFKFLLNDLIWSAGENYTADPGARVTVTPVF